MSKGINLVNHFNPPKPDGHKIIEHSVHGPMVLCPTMNDIVLSIYTSSGIICGKCQKMIH